MENVANIQSSDRVMERERVNGSGERLFINLSCNFVSLSTDAAGSAGHSIFILVFIICRGFFKSLGEEDAYVVYFLLERSQNFKLIINHVNNLRLQIKLLKHTSVMHNFCFNVPVLVY